MRWIPLLVLTYVVVFVQTSLGTVLSIPVPSLGVVSPDLAAIVAVYIALHARSGLDVALGAWVLGLALDLTSAGGVGASTAIGPMPLAYVLAAGMLYRIREAFFGERALTQALLALLFCLVAHSLWVAAQGLLAGGLAWHDYARILLQAAGLAVYTAALTPLGHYLLKLTEKWFIAAGAPRGQGRR